MDNVNALHVEPLSWRGYSQKQRVSLDRFAQKLSQPVTALQKISYCNEMFALMSNLTESDRIKIEMALLAAVDHSAILCPYMGVMPPGIFSMIRADLDTYVQSALFLVQTIAAEGSEGPTLQALMKRMPEPEARRFAGVLSTSRHNYTHFRRTNAYKDIVDLPLYTEFGIDILANKDNFAFSEFQIRYTTPYPHLLQKINIAYSEILQRNFNAHNLTVDTFPSARKELVIEAIDRYEAAKHRHAARVLIDAWGYLENAGANWKEFADELKAEYILFDDLSASNNLYERKYRQVSNLAVFNQPALHLIDPAETFFKTINDEKLEDYPELAWNGMLDRYLCGDVFLVHPPTTDILNDKAIYDFLPYIAKLRFDKEIQKVPTVHSLPLWSQDEPEKLNEKAVSLAVQNQAVYVIAHRYLEGGMGIRVGAHTAADEWKSFLETFVADRPYLYVLRKFFPMDPDLSLRAMGATLAPSYKEPALCTILSDTLFARFSLGSPLTSDNSSAFLIYPDGGIDLH